MMGNMMSGNFYDSIQENREREITDELKADGHPLKIRRKPRP